MDTLSTPAPDPLDKLFVQDNGARHIARFLLDYMRIDKGSGEVRFLEEGLTAIQRILLYLLSLRVSEHMHYRLTHTATPRQIGNALQINDNTVRVMLMKAAGAGLLRTDPSRSTQYGIAAGRIEMTKQHIEKIGKRQRKRKTKAG